MAYPYLADSFAATLYLLGMTLPGAMSVSGILMCAMVFLGYALLVAQLCRKRGTVVLATLLLFMNGGLGFFYTLGGSVQNGVVTTVWDNLRNVMQGYYQTPTNQPNPNNLRWVNIICDMLVPQRGILGGWAMLMPVLNLLLPPLAALLYLAAVVFIVVEMVRYVWMSDAEFDAKVRAYQATQPGPFSFFW